MYYTQFSWSIPCYSLILKLIIFKSYNISMFAYLKQCNSNNYIYKTWTFDSVCIKFNNLKWVLDVFLLYQPFPSWKYTISSSFLK